MVYILIHMSFTYMRTLVSMSVAVRWKRGRVSLRGVEVVSIDEKTEGRGSQTKQTSFVNNYF